MRSRPSELSDPESDTGCPATVPVKVPEPLALPSVKLSAVDDVFVHVPAAVSVTDALPDTGPHGVVAVTSNPCEPANVHVLAPIVSASEPPL
jgi:hypothetical protein